MGEWNGAGRKGCWGDAGLGEEVPEARGGEVDIRRRASEGGLGRLHPGGQAAPAPAAGVEAVWVGRQAQALREAREVEAVPPGRDGGLKLGSEAGECGDAPAALEELQKFLSVDGISDMARGPFRCVEDRSSLLPVSVQYILFQLESIISSFVSNKCYARFTLKAPSGFETAHFFKRLDHNFGQMLLIKLIRILGYTSSQP